LFPRRNLVRTGREVGRLPAGATGGWKESWERFEPVLRLRWGWTGSNGSLFIHEKNI
jgi:hypothetical protein